MFRRSSVLFKSPYTPVTQLSSNFSHPDWRNLLVTTNTKKFVSEFTQYYQGKDRNEAIANLKALAKEADDYELLRQLRNCLNELWHQHAHPEHRHHKDEAQALLWVVQRKIEAMHQQAVLRYTQSYQNATRAALLSAVEKIRHDLKVKSFANAEQIARLHAVEMLLHPEFAAVAIFDRGVYAAKAVKVARAQGYRTILLCLPHEDTSLAASLADHVLPVSDLGDVHGCIHALQKFNSILGVKGYRIGVDPGFGKLSESPELVSACQKGNFIFIGPDVYPMSVMGNKKQAKQLAEESGVPVIPGYFGEVQDMPTLIANAEKIGFPLMVKKGRSGGGYGNRYVRNIEEFKDAVSVFRGKDENEPVFFERYLENPLHIEIQVAIALDEFVLLGSRNCSLQRDCQKTIEEAPAVIPQLKKIMRYAKQLAESMMRIGYTHLGTIEFLVQGKDIYFLEVNPRIQVEHGVTEVIHHNLDLIGLKFWIASGKAIADYLELSLQDRDIDMKNKSAKRMVTELKKHSSTKFAIEARVEAMKFIRRDDGVMLKEPVKGVITEISLPSADISCGIKMGTEIDTMTVNPLLALPIGKGATRLEALRNLLDLLNKMEITGVPTNLARLRANVKYLIDNPHLAIDTSTTKVLDAEYIEHEATSHRKVDKLSQLHHEGLFPKRNVFVSGDSRIPEVTYTHKIGRNGHWD